mmetsp:Transcript_80199/g.175916  ORF Transcript_80199/g.175916 Transcript_80199/m.175916 type:complete len:234 (-) Transcript_80199:637-1338(-)|eukprot:CAMPEP_0206456742 /NCGR_PEP_ID=MMETSP0324_2-20121206/22550_1 /ASSEMBLY_ACC=CAM_ASM_000836 /TAXON_ID=2866 /ORGANISM="Crypthecodinium cohnii, Strain Seligo" /LENGTH=233 /DNA_ID=CAMNT_0053927737 /DNA_START=194 /DNA_END=895 /DNA_ORIENTATION=+
MARGPMTANAGARTNKGWSQQAGKGQRPGMRKYGVPPYHSSWDYAGYHAGYQHMAYAEAAELGWSDAPTSAAAWWSSPSAVNSSAVLSTDAGSRQPPAAIYAGEGHMSQDWMDFAHLYGSKFYMAGSDLGSEDGWMEPPGLTSTPAKDEEKSLQDSLPAGSAASSVSSFSDPESEIMSVRGGPWLSEFEDDESSSVDAWEPRLVRDAYCGHSEPKRRLPKGEPVKKAIPSWGA